MVKTSSVIARVNPAIKTEAEAVLSRLGIPMSGAITLFLHQVVLHRGIPFEMRLPRGKLPALEELDGPGLRAELKKGLDDIAGGRTTPLEGFAEDLRKEGLQ